MSAAVPKLETIDIVLFPNGVAEIAHNRPKRYNALSPQSYRVILRDKNLVNKKNVLKCLFVQDWLSALKWAANCEDVKVVVLTGRGKFYTSGQELSLPDMNDGDIEKEMERRRQTTT